MPKIKIHKFLKPSHKKTTRGFTLLFAALVGALVLSVGLAILNITLKQMTLSSAGRESQQSFYSADSGVECALFLDRGAGHMNSSDNFDCQLGFFGTPSSTPSGVTICGYDNNSPATYDCFGRPVTVTITGVTSDTVVSSFELSVDDAVGDIGTRNSDMSGLPVINGDMCFVVDVVKRLINNDIQTTIESRGYNTCSGGNNRFERAIRTVNF